MPGVRHARLLREEPIVSTLLRLAAPNVLNLPAIGGMIAFDGLFVGRLGSEALAGVSLAFPFVMLIQHTAQGRDDDNVEQLESETGRGVTGTSGAVQTPGQTFGVQALRDTRFIVERAHERQSSAPSQGHHRHSVAGRRASAATSHARQQPFRPRAADLPAKLKKDGNGEAV